MSNHVCMYQTCHENPKTLLYISGHWSMTPVHLLLRYEYS